MNSTAEASSTELSDRSAFSSWKEGQPPEGWFPGPLGVAEKAFYDRNGFLVLDRALDAKEIDAINAETTRICRNADLKVNGVPAAPAHLTDEEVLREILCIHFPHKISALMEKALAHPRLVQALTTLIGPDIKAMQSMLFVKAAGKPGQAWHQDEDFIPTRDRSLIGAWIALDDATVENGCLWILPGSHQSGVLWKREWHGDRQFDCTAESTGFPYPAADEVPVEVRKGSIVFFHGYTLHRSLRNQAPTGFRRALVNHYMSARSLLPWRYDETSGMGETDYRDIVMVAGTDPYAWKGTTDIAKAFVRPMGDGGCVNWVTKEPLVFKN